jgi:CubicO group peptidase (beta-lactamase class C family)
VDAAVHLGIQKGLYPGAVVLIGRRDSVLYAKGYGHMTWSPKSPMPDADSTLWDLASISKVVGTTSAIMRLVDAGLVDIEAPVSRYLPRFSGGDKELVTVRMLLDHTSGLPPYVRFYRLARTPKQAIDRLYAEPLRRRPGEAAEYSDLNAMLLGLLVEEVSGQPLDQFAMAEVFRPLGMRRTMYRPPRALFGWVVPTAKWRGRPVRGEVNDQNAARLGGVAGHAGLFSTARDLARYAQTWLRDGAGPTGPWVSPATLRLFLTAGARSGTRLLGWDSPDPAATPDAPSVFGNLISPSAYGHTGWTGTEIWIDPPRDLFVVFLTNRSFDPRSRHSIEQLKFVRAQLSDAALRLVPAVCHQELVARC